MSDDPRDPARAIGWFAWRLIALVGSLLAAARLASLSSVPWGMVGSGALLWAFGGWRAARPWVSALAVSVLVLGGAVFAGGVPWAVAAFVPLWGLLFWLPRLLPGAGLVAQWRRRPDAALGRWVLEAACGLADRLDRPTPGLEAVRLGIAAGSAWVGICPFLRNAILGGGDSTWYAAAVADHVLQWRAGQWPVFVGQTRYEAIGTVVPLRVAPYLQHAAVALDFLTGRSLSAYLLLNLTIVISAVAAGLSAYLCLRAVAPRARAAACLLTVLYVWSPGVIGLPYTGQLFMSVMTLPYLPLVFCGLVVIHRREGFLGWAMVAAGCAAAWLGHSPIGFWLCASAGLALAVRWIGRGILPRGEGYRVAGAAVLFLLLGGYVFVSSGTLAPQPTPSISVWMLLQLVRAMGPASLLPVSADAGSLSDIQLGYSLWLVFGVGVVLAWRIRDRSALGLGAAGVALICLALPIPYVNEWLWRCVPQVIIDVTNAAPMQRLYPILAACSVVMAAAVLSARGEGSLTQRRSVVIGLAVLAGWSGFQASRFVHRGSLIANTTDHSNEVLAQPNLALDRYSVALLSEKNRFFSIGVMDYNLEQRILGPNLRTYVASNMAAIAPGYQGGTLARGHALSGVLTGTSQPGDTHWVFLSPKLTLEPGKHYVLALDFQAQGYRGVFQVSGKGFYREYALPLSGEPFSFGSRRFASRLIPLSSEASGPLEVTLAFINQDPQADLATYARFARYELIEYSPQSLPIRLTSYLPYEAQVTSPCAGWLESFRYYLPGWEATVNGRPALVRRSWNDLTAVAIPQGTSVVRITYRAPLVLRLSYWQTLASWALLAGCALAAWVSPGRER